MSSVTCQSALRLVSQSELFLFTVYQSSVKCHWSELFDTSFSILTVSILQYTSLVSSVTCQSALRLVSQSELFLFYSIPVSVKCHWSECFETSF